MSTIRLLSSEWAIRPEILPARESLDPMIQRLVDGRPITVERFVATPKSAFVPSRVPAVATAEMAVVVSRHPSGAIRFHAPVAHGDGTTTFDLALATPKSGDFGPSSPESTRAFGAGVRLFLLTWGSRLVFAPMPELVRRWEESHWTASGRSLGWVKVERDRLSAGAALRPISSDDLRAAFAREGRVLLLLHGILSNAEAAFRGLALPAAGPAFLRTVADHYDLIAAYNHHTLSESPEENARAFLSSLPLDSKVKVDVITHSRGGIVFRNIVSRAAELGDSKRLPFGRAVMVAGPHQGSPLAAPTRLVQLLDVIANTAEAFPGSAFAHGVAFIGEALSWLAAGLARSLPAVECLVPGSDHMLLLESAPPLPQGCSVLTSNYEPEDSLLLRWLDAGVNELFGVANDLVVPTAGAWEVDGVSASDVASFGPGGNLESMAAVAHTGYFERPETAPILVDMLEGRGHSLRPLELDKQLAPAVMPAPARAPMVSPRPVETKSQAAGEEKSESLLLMLLPDGPSGYQLVARYRNAMVRSEFPTRGGEAGQRMSAIIRCHEQMRGFLRGKAGLQMPTEPELLDYGQMLFETLFPPEVCRLYDVAHASETDRRLDLIFMSSLDWIADKPWEFAWDPTRRTHLAIDEVNFTRNVFTAVPSQVPRRRAGPLRILIVSAQPVSAGALSIKEEEKVIASGFETLTRQGLVTIDILRAVTPAQLHRTLESKQWNVVHFIGHGEYDVKRGTGTLIFEDERHGVHVVDTRSLRSLFARSGVELVFLNACESGRGGLADYNRGVAPGLVAAGVPAVVANQYVVLDQSAASFASRFYASLAHGVTIGDAMRDARVSLSYEVGSQAIDWAVPVLFTRDPSERLCERSDAAVAPSKVRIPSRSRARNGAVEIGLWDMNGVLPDLEILTGQMSAAQDRFHFRPVRMGAPLGLWHLSSRAQRSVLDTAEAERMLGGRIAELGLDYLVCLTTFALEGSGGPFRMGGRFAALSAAAMGGNELRTMLVNAVVAALMSWRSGVMEHPGGASSCPAELLVARGAGFLHGPMALDPQCRLRIRKDGAEGAGPETAALDALLGHLWAKL